MPVESLTNAASEAGRWATFTQWSYGRPWWECIGIRALYAASLTLWLRRKDCIIYVVGCLHALYLYIVIDWVVCKRSGATWSAVSQKPNEEEIYNTNTCLCVEWQQSIDLGWYPYITTEDQQICSRWVRDIALDNVVVLLIVLLLLLEGA